LNTPIDELQETLRILKGEYVTLDTAYKQNLTKLDVLTTRLSILVSETALWEGTSKEVKATLNKQKRAFRKRKALGTQSSSSEPDLSNVEEWVLLYTGPRTAQQRIRDPLQHINVFDRLSCMWASQPMGKAHPFATVADRSTLTAPGEGKTNGSSASNSDYYFLPLTGRYVPSTPFCELPELSTSSHTSPDHQVKGQWGR
jgi:hypothetical protein